MQPQICLGTSQKNRELPANFSKKHETTARTSHELHTFFVNLRNTSKSLISKIVMFSIIKNFPTSQSLKKTLKNRSMSGVFNTVWEVVNFPILAKTDNPGRCMIRRKKCNLKPSEMDALLRGF